MILLPIESLEKEVPLETRSLDESRRRTAFYEEDR
jgi:hypothetical protein